MTTKQLIAYTAFWILLSTSIGVATGLSLWAAFISATVGFVVGFLCMKVAIDE